MDDLTLFNEVCLYEKETGKTVIYGQFRMNAIAKISMKIYDPEYISCEKIVYPSLEPGLPSPQFCFKIDGKIDNIKEINITFNGSCVLSYIHKL